MMVDKVEVSVFTQERICIAIWSMYQIQIVQNAVGFTFTRTIALFYLAIIIDHQMHRSNRCHHSCQNCLHTPPHVYGALLVGDFNIHHRKWLKFSHSNTAEGDWLYNLSHIFSLKQHVNQATRGSYLLDLALSDLHVEVKVLPMIADHKCLLITLPIAVPEPRLVPRFGWLFKNAHWEVFRNHLAGVDWSFVHHTPLDIAIPF